MPTNKPKLSKAINFFKIVRRTRPGTSLLVALGLTTIIVLVSLGVSSVVVSSIRDSANANGANSAYYAAEGAMEEGLLVNQENGAGYTAGQATTSPCPTAMATVGGTTPQPPCAVTAGYSISGQVPNTPNYQYKGPLYGIPTPGSGDAGTNCDQLNPDVTAPFWYSIAPASLGTITTTDESSATNSWTKDSTPQDNPCNWNKFAVGQQISIPLYVTLPLLNGQLDSSTCTHSPPGICNPVDILGSGGTLNISIRTPCQNGAQMCASSERYHFSPTDYDTIVDWSITGTSQDGTVTYNLSPDTYLTTLTKKPSPANTEITESKIYNAATSSTTPYIVLSQSKLGFDLADNEEETISEFLNDNSDGSAINLTTYAQISPITQNSERLNKPVLNLSIIHSLQDSSNSPIPYLEYQITSGIKSGAPTPTDSSQTITSEGYSGSFKQVLQVKQPQNSGILEYVIQQ